MIVAIDPRQFGPWKNLILVKPGIRKRHLQGDTRMNALIWIFSAVMLAACGTAEHSVRVEDEQAFTADTKVIVTQVINKTGESFDIDIETMLKDAMVIELAEQNLLGQPGTAQCALNGNKHY